MISCPYPNGNPNKQIKNTMSVPPHIRPVIRQIFFLFFSFLFCITILVVQWVCETVKHMETDLYIRGECACKYRGNWNWYFIARFYQPLFLFIDFLLYKSATEEQTNSPELSVLSEGQITYHFLHCAKLIMSEVACSGGLENTTLISTAERRAGLNCNEKINSICLEGYLCRDGFWLHWWKKE